MCRVQTRSCWLLQVDGWVLAVTPQPPRTRGGEVLGSGDLPAPLLSLRFVSRLPAALPPRRRQALRWPGAGTSLTSACARPITLGTLGRVSEGWVLKAESPNWAWGHASLSLGGSGEDEGPAAGAEQARKVSTDE